MSPWNTSRYLLPRLVATLIGTERTWRVGRGVMPRKVDWAALHYIDSIFAVRPSAAEVRPRRHSHRINRDGAPSGRGEHSDDQSEPHRV